MTTDTRTQATEQCDECGRTMNLGEATIFYGGKGQPDPSTRLVLCPLCLAKRGN